jgi:hypothetical protein
MFRIGGNTFYDWKNKIPIKVPEFKRSGIGIIAEFHRIPNGFPNQAWQGWSLQQSCQFVGVQNVIRRSGLQKQCNICTTFWRVTPSTWQKNHLC